jgi:aspartate/methionine/tyrosine aminotransferase
MLLLFGTLLDPGDEVLLADPCYPAYPNYVAFLGGVPVSVPVHARDGFRFDPAAVERAITPRTKAIVINSPHNPTGVQMTKEEFFAVKEIAEERGIHVFSDEVYRFLEHDPKDRLPPMADIYEKGISIGVMSKSFGLAGLRIGWTAAQDTGVLARMAALKDYTTICCSAPSEFLSALALRHREEIVERNLRIVRANLPLLDRFFARHADHFSWVRPSAGPIAFPRLLKGSAAAFCEEAVTGAGVLLLPSETYGYGDSHFRIGFARRDMPAALAALSDFLE